MKFKRNYKKAFTLIELLVVIAIGAILTVVLLPGFISARRYSQLDEDVTRVVIMIREAQEQSLYPNKNELGVQDFNFLCTTHFRRINETQVGITATFGTALNNEGKCANFSPTNINFTTQPLKYSTVNTITGIHFGTPFGEVIDRDSFSSGQNSFDIVLTHNLDNNLKRTITVKKIGIIDLK